MRAKVLRGPRRDRVGEVVGKVNTKHGLLTSVWFGGDEVGLYTEQEVQVLSKLTVVLMRGDDGVIDTVINAASGGIYSHAAIKILGSTLESYGVKLEQDKYPGVWLHDPDEYTGNQAARFIDVDVPDLAGAEAEARRLVGTLYGYTDCIRGGLYDLFKIESDGNSFTANCSETVTRILRAGGLTLLPGIEPDCVTPNDLGRWFDGQAVIG